MKIAIAGLGRAGARYSAVAIGSGVPVIRNHLDAALATHGIQVDALIDPDPAARSEAAANCPGAQSLERLDQLPEGAVDGIVLATPTANRATDVPVALRCRPRILVVEKPLAATAAEASAFLDLADEMGVAVLVNFNRRFDPAIRRFRGRFPGRPVAAIGRYGKGFRNYASHMVDLLIDWFGPVRSVQALDRPTEGDDPSLSFCLRFDGGLNAVCVGLEGIEYDQFELDLLFADCRLQLTNGGTEKWLQRPAKDLYYPGYPQLAATEAIEPPHPIGGFVELHEALRDHLDAPERIPGCSGREALDILRVQEAIMQSAVEDGKEIPVNRITQTL